MKELMTRVEKATVYCQWSSKWSNDIEVWLTLSVVEEERGVNENQQSTLSV